MRRTLLGTASAGALVAIVVGAGISPAFAEGTATENLTDYAVEDAAPTLVVGGVQFDGSTAGGQAVDAYHAESVALSSITQLGFTVAAAPADGQADPAYALEVDTDGTSASYTTLSAEPYQNGQALNAAGDFEDVAGWAFWSSHLSADADGGQSHPEPLSWFETQYPSATVISHGLHLGSASTGSTSVVSATSFNGAVTDFTHGAQGSPIVVTAAPSGATATGDPTLTGIDPQTGIGTEHQLYSISSALGAVYYDVPTANVKDPEAITGLTAPTVTQPQGATSGTIILPAVDGGSWSLDGAGATAGQAIPESAGTHTATFTPSDGHTVYPVDAAGGVVGSNGAVSFTLQIASQATAIEVTKEPWITGTPQVGKTLTANMGAISPSSAKVSYQWLLNGVAITSGGTGKTFTPASVGYVGKKLSVRITITYPGLSSIIAPSAETAPVKGGTLTSATPHITGTVKVGGRLTASPGTWTAGTTLHYQWWAGGKALPGETYSVYSVRPALAGEQIAVKVTGSKSGYTTVTKTSPNTAKVAALPMVGSNPTVKASTSVSGTPIVGATLHAYVGSWTAGTSFRFQWYANSTPIAGATKSAYTIPASLSGHTFHVAIKGTKVGYTSLTKFSATTKSSVETKAYYTARSGNKTTYRIVATGLEGSTRAGGADGDPGEMYLEWEPYGDPTAHTLDYYTGAASYSAVITLANAPSSWWLIAAIVDPGYDEDGSPATATETVYEKPAGAPDVYYAVHSQDSSDSVMEADLYGGQ